MTVGPRTKMVLGALLGVLGVWWYVPGGGMNNLLAAQSTMTNLKSLIALFQGTVGMLAVIIGLFVVWIEHDEMKMRRELDAEDLDRSVQGQVQAVPEDDGAAAQDEPGAEGETDDGDSDTFRCDACDRTFDTERGLSVHRSQVHED